MRELLAHYGPSLLSGFFETIKCTVVGSVLAIILGMFLALFSTSRFAWLKAVTAVYVWIFRGTPFLVQVFLLYSGGPSIGLRLSPFMAGVLSLAMFGSSYCAEIFRAGMGAIPRGQIEAARMLGMNGKTIFTRIICPPLLLETMPMLVNTVITLLKETVVLSIIIVPELMYQIQTMAAETFAYVPSMLSMALAYWVLVEVISQLGRFGERRLGVFRK